MNYGSKQNMKKCEMEDPRTKNVIDKIYTAIVPKNRVIDPPR